MVCETSDKFTKDFVANICSCTINDLCIMCVVFFTMAGGSGYGAVFSGVEPLLDRLPPHHRSTLDTILKHLAKLVGVKEKV